MFDEIHMNAIDQHIRLRRRQMFVRAHGLMMVSSGAFLCIQLESNNSIAFFFLLQVQMIL